MLLKAYGLITSLMEQIDYMYNYIYIYYIHVNWYFNKLFDLMILLQEHISLSSSPLQYGFKKGTTQLLPLYQIRFPLF